jgi:DNA-binding SARP family transcriptional activator/tetratricopeptide (TPR) repeat protein
MRHGPIETPDGPSVRVEFGLLGPLTVTHDGVSLPVASGKQRAVLAALLVRANQVVPVDELIELVWTDPPPSARVTVQNYVKRLRQALDAAERARLVTRPSGYLMHVAADELDITVFSRRSADGHRAAKAAAWDGASAHWSAALSLWRGRALADVPSQALALGVALRLEEMRWQTLEARIDADLHLGRDAEVAAEARQLVAAEPLRERLHAALMLALYRCGQQADALAAYQRARRLLIKEIGVEPGSALQILNQRILHADPGLLPSGPAASTACPPPGESNRTAAAAGAAGPRYLPRSPGPIPAIPRQLPPAVPHFAGRADALTTLASHLALGAAPGAAAVISAISGAAGTGKTTLAIHWAHRVADEFPAGQLYVNLRGFDPADAPMTPAQAVRGFLSALAVPPARIPADLDAQVGLYRSLVAGQRMLVLLDNARDAEQVRPLLPGSAGTLTLVTSRSQLSGLVIGGARPVLLDVLTEPEARQLLAAVLGPERVAAEEEHAAALISLCAALPLALAIGAARGAVRPHLPLASLAAELREAAGRLDVLDGGDPLSSVRTVFSWSYQLLRPPAARMFRLLGIHPGPDVSAAAAASLAGISPAHARRLIGELAAAHLVAEHIPGRYTFHDLLRAYAAEQAGATDDDGERQAATRRMLDHYLHTAHAAVLLINPVIDPVLATPPDRGVAPEQLADAEQAMAWFHAEHHVLLNAVARAGASGLDMHAWQLAWILGPFLNRQGHRADYAASCEIALAAARRIGDPAGLAHAHHSCGRASQLMQSYDDARAHYGRAAGLFRQAGHQVGEARAHLGLGQTLSLQGRHRAALRQARHALSLLIVSGDTAGRANAGNAVAWQLAQIGDYEQALAYGEEALVLCRELHYPNGEADILDSLGYAHQKLGHHLQAATCFRRSSGLYGDIGSLKKRADALTRLGDTHLAAGDPRAARDCWQAAHQILDDLRHPDTEQLSTRLAGLTSGRRPGPAAPVASPVTAQPVAAPT